MFLKIDSKMCPKLQKTDKDMCIFKLKANT